jgi:hypothetical protein
VLLWLMYRDLFSKPEHAHIAEKLNETIYFIVKEHTHNRRDVKQYILFSSNSVCRCTAFKGRLLSHGSNWQGHCGIVRRPYIGNFLQRLNYMEKFFTVVKTYIYYLLHFGSLGKGTQGEIRIRKSSLDNYAYEV